MALLIRDVGEMQEASRGLRLSGSTIGVVPTMGALHRGHLELIRTARRHASHVITTVFVNPAQFGPSEDFARYPRNLDSDLALAAEAGTDIVFAPDVAAIYPDGYSTYVSVTKLDEVLEGRIRPGHFRGVATVVLKLFHLTRPHFAVFGQKDAQQSIIITRMVHDLNVDVKIVIAPIVREHDGLALSSRNVYLTPAQRNEAPVLYRGLQLADEMIRSGERKSERITTRVKDLIKEKTSGGTDYVSVANAETLEELADVESGQHVLVSLAVRFGSTRLIDNITVVVP